MANRYTYNKSLSGGREPMRLLMPCAAGTTAVMERGDICELESSYMSRLDSDQAAAAVVAICDEEIKTTSLAGYYPFIIPRPGDVFDYDLATAGNPSRAASLYWSSHVLLAESGNEALCTTFDHAGYPKQQGRPDVGDATDRGTTIRNTTRVSVTFVAAASYYAAVQA